MFVDVWKGLNVRLAICGGETAISPAKCRCGYIGAIGGFYKLKTFTERTLRVHQRDAERATPALV
jgi:hypothetical protein